MVPPLFLAGPLKAANLGATVRLGLATLTGNPFRQKDHDCQACQTPPHPPHNFLQLCKVFFTLARFLVILTEHLFPSDGEFGVGVSLSHDLALSE